MEENKVEIYKPDVVALTPMEQLKSIAEYADYAISIKAISMGKDVLVAGLATCNSVGINNPMEALAILKKYSSSDIINLDAISRSYGINNFLEAASKFDNIGGTFAPKSKFIKSYLESQGISIRLMEDFVPIYYKCNRDIYNEVFTSVKEDVKTNIIDKIRNQIKSDVKFNEIKTKVNGALKSALKGNLYIREANSYKLRFYKDYTDEQIEDLKNEEILASKDEIVTKIVADYRTTVAAMVNGKWIEGLSIYLSDMQQQIFYSSNGKVKDNWNRQPNVMQMWRAITKLARLVDNNGNDIYTKEEVASFKGVDVDITTVDTDY